MANVNRRRWKRYTVEGAFVVTTRPSFWKLGKPVHTRVGPVKDIGMGGLAVQYVEKKIEPKKMNRVSVMLPSEGVLVDPIPFEPVNHFEVTTLPHTRKKVWTLCICFKKLMPEQKLQLERFIADYGFEVIG